MSPSRPLQVWLAAALAAGPALAAERDTVRLSAVSQVWSPEGRTVEAVTAKLDEAARDGADLVLLPQECVLTDGEPIPGPASDALAKKAAEHRMYVLVAGVIDRIERNEAILYDREGNEAGRYAKMAKTHDEMVPGDAAPVFETDFGRVAARICADEWIAELDRAYAVQGADILFTPTQSWGPDALFRDLRDVSRAIDGGFFLVEATHPSTEARHRSVIVDPAGAIVASSEYRKAGIVSAVIDLDADRPQRYLRESDPHTPGGYLPEYQPTQMPRAKNDLREAILASRRPELYKVLAPK